VRTFIGRLKLLGTAEFGPVPSHPLGLVFRGGLELSGYDLSSTMPEPASTITLTLYWSPTGPLSRDYTVSVHFAR